MAIIGQYPGTTQRTFPVASKEIMEIVSPVDTVPMNEPSWSCSIGTTPTSSCVVGEFTSLALAPVVTTMWLFQSSGSGAAQVSTIPWSPLVIMLPRMTKMSTGAKVRKSITFIVS